MTTIDTIACVGAKLPGFILITIGICYCVVFAMEESSSQEQIKWILFLMRIIICLVYSLIVVIPFGLLCYAYIPEAEKERQP